MAPSWKQSDKFIQKEKWRYWMWSPRLWRYSGVLTTLHMLSSLPPPAYKPFRSIDIFFTSLWSILTAAIELSAKTNITTKIPRFFPSKYFLWKSFKCHGFHPASIWSLFTSHNLDIASWRLPRLPAAERSFFQNFVNVSWENFISSWANTAFMC